MKIDVQRRNKQRQRMVIFSFELFMLLRISEKEEKWFLVFENFKQVFCGELKLFESFFIMLLFVLLLILFLLFFSDSEIFLEVSAFVFCTSFVI